MSLISELFQFKFFFKNIQYWKWIFSSFRQCIIRVMIWKTLIVIGPWRVGCLCSLRIHTRVGLAYVFDKYDEFQSSCGLTVYIWAWRTRAAWFKHATKPVHHQKSPHKSTFLDFFRSLEVLKYELISSPIVTFYWRFGEFDNFRDFCEKYRRCNMKFVGDFRFNWPVHVCTWRERRCIMIAWVLCILLS